MVNAIRWMERHVPLLTFGGGVALIIIGVIMNLVAYLTVLDAADGAAAARGQIAPAVALVDKCSNQVAMMERVMIGTRVPHVLLLRQTEEDTASAPTFAAPTLGLAKP